MSPHPRLYLNHVAELDWLIALELGRSLDHCGRRVQAGS